jgi:hypothetical protein
MPFEWTQTLLSPGWFHPGGGVWVFWRRGSGFVALAGAVLAGDAAGQPLADPQHALEVTNGCPPAFRA